MQKEFNVIGMTCSSCEAKVSESLSSISGVHHVEVSKDKKSAIIESDRQLSIEELQAALDPKYMIAEMPQHTSAHSQMEDKAHWTTTYKPILLVFAYITGICILIQITNERWDIMQFMQHFMAGFFLIFSFFKLLNLKGFAESYRMYDIVAKAIPSWSYIYAFVELALGILFLTNFAPLMTNIITFIVMSVSIIGVLQSVLNKKKIKCACLGAIFNLPMSTITIIEDGLMILMSAYMIIHLL